jgi:pyruvate dehydrogenase E2 component (dihydrolipoamide acetyltransferase)
MRPLQVAALPAVHAKPELPISTPRARRVARELGIDWLEVAGSGRGGRIREADIRAHSPAAMSLTRRTIAARMIASQQKTAPVTLHTTADASALVQLRAAFKADPASPVLPGYNDMMVKLTAKALEKHPALNSRWEGEHLRTLPDVHIGIAVDTEAGLLVPVIRDAAKLSLHDIAARSRELTLRARSARLTAEELRGGTFTITSLGSFGIDAFTPVINYPECAILGVGRIVRHPVAAGDAIVLRDVITLSLTFDHCAFDGAPAARFLQTLVQLIESPASLS